MLNILIPLVIIALSLIITISKIRNDPDYLFTPLIWFLLASTVYFGFAPLIYIYGNQASIDYLQRFFFVDNDDLLKTNYLNIVGLTVTIISYYFCPKLNTNKLKFKIYKFNNLFLNVSFFSLYLASFLILFMRDCLKFDYGQLPEILFELQYSVIALSVLLINKKNKIISSILIIVIAIILLINLISFSKLKIIQCLIIIIISLYLRFKNIKYLLLGIVLLVILFPLLDRFIAGYRDIGYGNNTKCEKNISKGNHIYDNEVLINSQIESNHASNLRKIFQNSIKYYNNSNYKDKIYYPWIRFVLTPNQLYVMKMYDSGVGSRSLMSALWIPIPRMIYPQKPIIHPLENIHDERKDLILNSGYFAEGYWNYGWIGVAIISIIIGIYLKFGEGLGFYIIKNKIYFLLPVVINSIVTIHRVEDWFVVNIIASIFKIAYLFLILMLINKLFIIKEANKK